MTGGLLRSALGLIACMGVMCSSPESSPPRSSAEPDPFAREPLPLSEVTGALPGAPPGADPAGTTAAEETRDVVARIEVELPSSPRFVLHACIPVPADFDPGEPGRTRLALVSRKERTPVPAQIEVVSRGPLGQIEVIEVLAVVERAERDSPHRRVGFQVLRGDWELPPQADVPSPALALLDEASGGPFALRTRDVFGNTYRFPLRGAASEALGSRKTLKHGHAHVLERRHGALVPDELSGAGDPLPRLLGVHAYLGRWSETEVVTLDLRLHHGLTPASGERDPRTEPLGPIHWDGLELELPPGWSAAPLATDPFSGTARVESDRVIVPIVAPYEADGDEPADLHAAIPGVQFERRLVLFRGDPASEAPRSPQLSGLGFCDAVKGRWSWFEKNTVGYLAQREVLPGYGKFKRDNLSGVAGLRRSLAARRNELARLIERGTANGHDVRARVLGWAHPWYVRAQGGTGGAAVQITEGHEAAAAASVEGIEWLMLMHRMNISRQPTAMYTWDGEPAGFHAWLTDEDKIPFDYRTNGRMFAPELKLPCEGGPPPNPHWQVVQRTKRRPRYDRGPLTTPRSKILDEEENLWAWMAHDGAHLSRYVKNPKALAWLANDALAKDDVLLTAELFRLQFHENEHHHVPWSAGVTLREFFRTAARPRPGTGAHLGREHGWGMDMMSSAYSIADDAWRERNQAWFAQVGQMLLAVAMPNGLVIRNNNSKILGHDKYDAAQAFQSLFILHGVRTMIESALRGVDPELVRELEAFYHRSLRALFWPPIYQRIPWQEKYQPKSGPRRYYAGPRVCFAVAEHLDKKTPPFSDEDYWGPQYMPEDGFNGGVEFFHVWSALEYGYLLDGGEDGLKNRYLKRALACWTVPKTLPILAEQLFEQTRKPSTDNSGNWAGFLGRLQALGAWK